MKKKTTVIIIASLTAVLFVGAWLTGMFRFDMFDDSTEYYGNDLIKVSYPLEDAIITSPLTVTGQARGNWYFEATFPIVVVNWDGLIIGEGYAQADGDPEGQANGAGWMTTDFVPFEGTVEFENPVFPGADETHFSRKGWVIFQKNNPSGLPEHDDALEVPIFFKTKDAVELGRLVTTTDGVKHSIPIDKILSGGPPKDGIPAIDEPKFTGVAKADEWLDDEEAGQGFCVGQDCRFYPYQILVFHEIVNDTVGGQPALVTYCPLCLTGIVFDRNVNGQVVEFGTSGMLWQSNLVMYNRTKPDDEGLTELEKRLRLESKEESLWSQVLGEAVVGELTGTKLKILSSDVIKYGDWKKVHPDTKVLSKDTGFARTYGYDPYGSYYTSNEVSFGASFNDDRLRPKEFVLGINIDGKFKAYHSPALKVGETVDTFNGEKVIITKSEEGIVRMFKSDGRESLPYIGGFWFSWLAVHPETELYR